jgi:hypothetical protein
MRRLTRLACALLFAYFAPAAAAQDGPIAPDDARLYFGELRELAAADAGRMWGRSLAGPVLFVDRASRAVIASAADPGGHLVARDGIWTGTLPQEVSIANAAVDWSGTRWTMLMWPVPDNRYVRRRLLLHESFHRIQPELGLPGGNPPNAHLATADARIWMRLEWRALAEALLRDGDDRSRALHDALTFRAARHAMFGDAAEEERQLELNEGLAEYTGHVLSGLPRSAVHDRAAAQLASQEQQENFSRSFAYVSGPAYALLLDARDPPWRTRISAATDLASLAAAAYALSPVDPATAGEWSQRYTPARMIREERVREERRVAAEGRLRARFIDGSVLTLPVTDDFRYSFDPNAAIPLAGTGTVYERSRLTAAWGILDVTSGGVLLRRDDGGRIIAIVVPVQSGEAAPLSGEGWELRLTPSWTLTRGSRAGDWLVVAADQSRP